MPELPEVETVRAQLEPKLVGRRLTDVQIADPRLTMPHDPTVVAAKAATLDQRRRAGVGNVYADEALWRAQIHPQRPAGELTEAEIAALHRGIRAALRAGIARQGATLRDYRTPGGASGQMQHEFKVYSRTGEPCERCGTSIEKMRAAGRGTWY